MNLLDKDFLTVDEVAEHLRVSNTTVFRLIKKGTMESIKVGRLYRITPKQLVQFLEGDQGAPRKEGSNG